MPASPKLSVFLCHASKDKSAVRELCRRLRSEGWIDPWLDEEKLLPGQDWHLEIEKAVEVTNTVIVFLSNNSVAKEGYIQRELKHVLDIVDEKPEGTLFIVPLRLDDCPTPRRLRAWQYVDYFPAGRKDWAYERVVKSLKLRAEAIGIGVARSEDLIPHELILSNGIEFILVSRGKFSMGSKDNNKLAFKDEKPQHIVDIPYYYWIARFPITNELYNSYVRVQGIKHPVDGWEKKKDRPVVDISWKDAMAYCQWLNEVLKGELPSGLILRLPTEAEWEKAARGTDGLEWPWGNEFDENKCNSSEGERRGTTPVNLYSPQGNSPYGCADMVGNVWEWTHTLYRSYPYKGSDGREREIVRGRHVLRGGSCLDDHRRVRCAYRHNGDINHYLFGSFYEYYGFRLVAAPLSFE